ncbi:MAG: hypothetical protein KA780_08490 [Prolixibacteraceae bacterium]|nr:hypothetical protein [Prolixibacteraceae bacterium]NLX29233.1 hypothetical protein [Bacteroidales bacterium]
MKNSSPSSGTGRNQPFMHSSPQECTTQMPSAAAEGGALAAETNLCSRVRINRGIWRDNGSRRERASLLKRRSLRERGSLLKRRSRRERASLLKRRSRRDREFSPARMNRMRSSHRATNRGGGIRRSVRTTAMGMALVMFLSACSTTSYIHDQASLELQKEIKNKRAGNVFGDIFLTTGSMVLAVLTGVFVYSPSGNRSLKKVALQNNGPDTLQVNMLTDLTWKDENYADMMDIRIPPGKTARLLLPAGAVYNLYFSNTPGTEADDEFLVFDTATMRKVTLYQGLTLTSDSTSIIREERNTP